MLGRFPRLASISKQVAAHQKIFLDRHVGKNGIVLKDISDPGILELRAGCEMRDVATKRDALARLDFGEPENRMQHRRFASSIRPDRSEDSRAGKEVVLTFRYRWAQENQKK